MVVQVKLTLPPVCGTEVGEAEKVQVGAGVAGGEVGLGAEQEAGTAPLTTQLQVKWVFVSPWFWTEPTLQVLA